MINSYTQNLLVSSSQTDIDSALRFDAILTIFQDVTTNHSNLMGIDHDALLKSSNAFWVLSKMKFNLKGKITVSTPITASTWPLKPSLVRFNRNYRIQAETGVIDGRSEWCILDAETQAIRRFDSIKYDLVDHLDDPVEVENFSRLKEEVTPSDFVYKYKTVLTDIDCNGHVNNVAYSRMALNVFSPQEFVKYGFSGFEIHFIKQTFFDSEIDIYKKTLNNSVYVEGKLLGDTIFKAMFIKD